MSQDIWTQCAPKFRFSHYDAEPWRVVEAQHIVATRKLVDSDEEQAILEALIDEVKPPQPHDQECSAYHYLLWTPFRYPPLKRGSRMGTADLHGLWYGSHEIETAFTERAYYSFLIRAGSDADFGVFDTTVTAFSVLVSSRLCADLTCSPFKQFEHDLTSPDSYVASQKLASELWSRGSEVICFRSARCPNNGTNVAIAKLSVFQKRKPAKSTTWFCVSSDDTVEFKPVGLQSVTSKQTIFLKTNFQVNGKFPAPQC